MATVKDFATLIFVGTWLLVTLSACETSKHAEIMSTEDLRAQTQMSTATDIATETESEQSGIPLDRQSISQESLDLAKTFTFTPEPPPSPTLPPSDEGRMMSLESGSDVTAVAPPARPKPTLPEVPSEFPRGHRGPASDYVPEPPPQAFRDARAKGGVRSGDTIARVDSLEESGGSLGEGAGKESGQAAGPAAEPEAAPLSEAKGEELVQAEEPAAEPEAAPLSEAKGEELVQAEGPAAEPETALSSEVKEEELVQAEGAAAESEVQIAQLGPSDFVPESPAPDQEEGRDRDAAADSMKDETVAASMNGDGAKDPGLGDVFFDYDKYTIRSDAVAVLEKNAELLRNAYENSSVLIEGHCDERGTVDYNLELGKRRAQAVKDYLIDLGVKESRIRIVSYGKEKPFCTESKPGCWQKNRRGHFVQQ